MSTGVDHKMTRRANMIPGDSIPAPEAMQTGATATPAPMDAMPTGGSDELPLSPVEHVMHPAHQLLADTPSLVRVRPWQLALAMGLLAFVLYLVTRCWVPSTRSSMAFLVHHLGSDYSVPMLDLPWDAWMRLAIHLPWLDLSGWTALLCALLGACSVGLLTWLMGRVSYFYTMDAPASTVRREAVARRIAAVTAGVYLMVAAPFWWSSTRAMPGTLLTVWLLASAMFFSAFQRTGHLGWLTLFSLFWGLGCAWHLAFWFLGILVLVLCVREFIRWRCWTRWSAYAALLLPALAGSSCLLLGLEWSFRHGGFFVYGSHHALLRALVKTQIADMYLAVPYTPFLILLAVIAFVPWWILFVLSHRSPWFYERGATLLRLFLAAHLVVLFFAVPYAPWRLIGGLDNPFLVPVLLLAGCAGYLAGEFWCMGQIFPFKDDRPGVRLGKRALSAAGVVLAPLVLGAGLVNNLPTLLQSRAGSVIWEAANEALDQRGDRMVFFPDAFFDDALALAAEERGLSILMFREPSRCSLLFKKGLARAVPQLAALLDADAPFPRIMASFLLLPHAPETTVLLPGPEYVRNFVDVEPRGFAWHPHPLGTLKARAAAASSAAESPSESTAAPADPAGLLRAGDLFARELPFYQRLADWRERPLAENTLEWFYREVMTMAAARSANDLALDLAHEDDLSTAHQAAVLATRIDPGNLAAHLNAVQFLDRPDAPSPPRAPETWAGLPAGDSALAELQNLAGQSSRSRVRSWTMFNYDGLVAAPDAWILRGLPWAASGVMPAPAAVLAETPGGLLGMHDDTPRARWFQCVFERIGTYAFRPDQVCAAMANAPRNAEMLLELVRTYLMSDRPELAAGTLAAALELLPPDAPGFPLEEVLVDAATAGILPIRFPPNRQTLDEVSAPDAPRFPRRWTAPDGRPLGLRGALLQVASADPSDIRPWIALWLLEPNEPAGRLAYDKFKPRTRTDPELVLSLVAALQASGVNSVTAASFSLLRPHLHLLASSPVLWRQICLSSIAKNDRFSIRSTYARLARMLSPEELEAAIPLATLYEIPEQAFSR